MQAAARAFTRAASRAVRRAPVRAVAAGLTFGAAGLSLSMASPVQCAEAAEASVPFTGVPGTRHERTFIAVKPDGVQRGLVGEIIKRFETKGYKLVALKLLQPTLEEAAEHYSDLSDKKFFPGLIRFFSSGPIVAMVWEGHNAIKGGRVLLGETNPQASRPGTIRGDMAVEVGRNICHGSDGPDSAKAEITNWFKPEQVWSYEKVVDTWVYE